MTRLLMRLFIKQSQSFAEPRTRRAVGTMASIVGIILNALLFTAKFLVGSLVGSVAITADAVNNLSDAGSQILSFISFRVSAKPADREHPFGHARIEYVASMIVSFLVLLIGVELLSESVRKICNPDLPERSWVSAAVLGGSVLVKLWLGVFNRTLGKKIDSDVMRATAVDCFSDALSTSAVLIATLALLLFPSLTVDLDAYMGVVVAVLILISGIKILNETKNSILGEAPSEEIVKEISTIVTQTPGVLGLHDLVVHNYGPGHVIAALHVEVDGKEDIFVSHDMVDNIERRLCLECGIEATIHMDPIVTDDERTTYLRERVLGMVQKIDPRLRIHDFRFVEGQTHSNLIFDIEVPFEVSMTDRELRYAVEDGVSRLDPTYFAVITVDRT